MPAFSNSQAFAVVESELGVPFGDVYELVEPEPIAAASIGQASSTLVTDSILGVENLTVFPFHHCSSFYFLLRGRGISQESVVEKACVGVSPKNTNDLEIEERICKKTNEYRNFNKKRRTNTNPELLCTFCTLLGPLAWWFERPARR